MYTFKITVKRVPNNDIKIMQLLHTITEKPLIKIKEYISKGLPIYWANLSYPEYYGKDNVADRLITFLHENDLDVIIEFNSRYYDKRKVSLSEYIKLRNEEEINREKSMKKMIDVENNPNHPIHKYPEDRALSLDRAAARFLEKNYDGVIDDCNKLIELYYYFHDYYFYYYLRGRAYEMKGDYNCALSDYNKSLEINPDSNEVREQIINLENKIEIEKRQIINFSEAIRKLK